jgi:hypothetical protein
MTKRNLTLAIALVAVVLTAAPAFAGTLTGAAPLSGAGPTVTLTVPSRVGISWQQDVAFDLGAGTQFGSCGSYPPAPATSFPCYWGDDGAGGPNMTVQFFANTSGAGNSIQATILGQNATAFTGSNATIANVFYAPAASAACAAGDATAACVAKGYTQMSGTAATTFVSGVAAPTTGWTSSASNTMKFVFQVNNNLTTTTGSPTKTTTFNVTLP